jgi:hypothetical protein
MTTGLLDIALSLVLMDMLQIMFKGMSLNIKDYQKIIAISEDNRWQPKYR